MRFLVVESKTEGDRERRHAPVGKSSGETFAATLEQLSPGNEITRGAPADAGATPVDGDAIGAFDAVFLAGSPLHVYDDTPEVRRQLAFMRAVYASGVPAFRSCAGLQLAVASDHGTVRAMQRRMEAAIARGISLAHGRPIHIIGAIDRNHASVHAR